jgi:hypothetical protein
MAFCSSPYALPLVAIRPLDRKRIEKALVEYCERVPVHVRHKLRHGFEFTGSAVVLFETRPVFDDPKRWTKHRVAKFRYIASREIWELYCQLRDLKWHQYERLPSAGSFEILLKEVERDPTGIFWG